MRFGKLALSALAGFLLSAGLGNSLRADVITFEGLSTGLTSVPNDYDLGGLHFNTSFAQYIATDAGEQGARNGTDVFINGFSTETITSTSGNPFRLNSYDLGLSYYTQAIDTVQVTYNYFGGGSFSDILTEGQFFTHYNVNQPLLTSVQFSTPQTGGGYIALDNITFNAAAVPELSTMLGFGSFVALGGLAAFRQRKQARKAA